MNHSRCDWVTKDQIYIDYHDNEWGKPLYDDKKLFEMLNLEIMQAGLSWLTVLKKRKAFQKYFDKFDAKLISNYDDNKFNQLLNTPEIIRNKRKIRNIIDNAKAYLKLKESKVSFSDFLWSFVDNKPIINHRTDSSCIPSQTDISIKLSKALKELGFTGVGPTTVYSFMQAVGMVNDHTQDCFLHVPI